MKRWCFSIALKILCFVLLAGLALGTLTMILWNWLIPSIFEVREITFIEALGIVLLSKVLFGFGGWKKGHCGCHVGHHPEGHKGYWKKKWEDKFSKMNPEDKEKFKQSFKRCWGGDYDESQQKGQ